jgi:hypothetical protein
MTNSVDIKNAMKQKYVHQNYAVICQEQARCICVARKNNLLFKYISLVIIHFEKKTYCTSSIHIEKKKDTHTCIICTTIENIKKRKQYFVQSLSSHRDGSSSFSDSDCGRILSRRYFAACSIIAITLRELVLVVTAAFFSSSFLRLFN